MANETLDYARDNMSGRDLTKTILMSAVKALITSIVIVFAAVKIFEAGTPAVSGIYRQSVTLYLVIFIPSFLILLRYMIRKETTWRATSIKELFYTEGIESYEFWVTLLLSWLYAAGWSVVLQFIIVMALWYSGIATTILINSGLASGLLILAYRDKINSWKYFGTLILYGCIAGNSIFALGVVIALAIDMFGFAVVASVLLLEIIFTVIYSYMDLTAWVKESRTRKATTEELEQQRDERESLNEIAGRLRDDMVGGKRK